jgi:hypothetical protein
MLANARLPLPRSCDYPQLTGKHPTCIRGHRKTGSPSLRSDVGGVFTFDGTLAHFVAEPALEDAGNLAAA